jgi:hypothetical protein
VNTITNIKGANFYNKLELFFKMFAAERNAFLPAHKHRRIGEAVDRLLEEAHKLEDRAAAKGDVYLRQAVDMAIVQVHQMADILESLEYQLTDGQSCRRKGRHIQRYRTDERMFTVVASCTRSGKYTKLS